MDGTAGDRCPFWKLSPPEIQQRILRQNLIHALETVSGGSIGPEDFVQEVSLDLNRLPETVLLKFNRSGWPKPINIQHYWRFIAVQKKSFFRLVGPYRWKKRGERVVPYADVRWAEDP